MSMDPHFSSKSNEWATPPDFYERLNAEFAFTLDPCATPENAKCGKFFTVEQDGLQQDWSGETVFMNPPYGRQIGNWVKKAFEESLKGATVVCLIPSRTDTSYWHDYAMKGEIRYLRGRLYFGDGTGPAPFPSALVIFRSGKRSNNGSSKIQHQQRHDQRTVDRGRQVLAREYGFRSARQQSGWPESAKAPVADYEAGQATAG